MIHMSLGKCGFLIYHLGKELYNVLCELIPKLKTRQSGASRAGGSEPQGSSAGSGGGSSGAGGGTSKKKKGRRK